MRAASAHASVLASVLLLHAAGLWALQSGLKRPALERIVPARLLAQLITPPPPPVVLPAPEPAPAPPAPTPPKPAPPKPSPPKPPPPKPHPKPRPAPVRPAPVAPASPTAPVALPAQPVEQPAEPVPAPVSTPSPAPAPDPAPVPAAPPAPPPVVVQPSSNAAYLNNPPPPYPPMSRRLGEAGRVVVRVLIGIDGRAQDARIQRSSGFERLDQVALQTARQRWRYLPGTRGGVPEAMWFNVPINFVLE